MNLRDFEEVEWDPEEDPEGNLAHCMQPEHLGPNPERVVYEVLSEQPALIKFRTYSADFSVVGPDRSRVELWLVLFVVSSIRGDWLRPVTGWRAEPAEVAQWQKQFGELSSQ